MLTRRSFMGGAGAAIGLSAGSGRVAASEPVALRFVERGSPSGSIGLEGLDPEGALWRDAGRTSRLEIANALPEALPLSWRGLRSVGDLDHLASPLPSGATSDIAIPALEPGTALLRAAPQASYLAARGAQAVVAIKGDNDPAVDRDLVLHLTDRLVSADGSMVFGSVPPANATMGSVLINGTPEPRILTLSPRSRLRLRLVNGSVQRLMVVSCSGARPMILAIDGQPSELFAPVRNAVPIGPGARYDLIFDMPETPDGEVRFTLKPTLTLGGRLEAERTLMVLKIEGTPAAAKPPIAALPPNVSLPAEIPLEKARRVELVIDGQAGTATSAPSGWSIAPRPNPGSGRPVLSVRRSEAVTLGFTNATASLVPLRIGGQAVRLLHANDDGWEPYWRDTLLLPPKGRAHVAFVADRPGRWPIDSGFDDLTLAGLSCFFTVTP